MLTYDHCSLAFAHSCRTLSNNPPTCGPGLVWTWSGSGPGQRLGSYRSWFHPHLIESVFVPRPHLAPAEPQLNLHVTFNTTSWLFCGRLPSFPRRPALRTLQSWNVPMSRRDEKSHFHPRRSTADTWTRLILENFFFFLRCLRTEDLRCVNKIYNVQN